jgi:hypothetical protein
MVKSGTWNSLPYVSISLPYFSGAAASSEASEDSEVEEGEWRGESLGETTALESESAVVEVTFLLRNGLLAAGRLEAVAGAMVLDREGSIDVRELCRVLRSGGGRGRQEEPRSTTGEEKGREKSVGVKGKKNDQEALSAVQGLENFVWVLLLPWVDSL